MSECEEPGGIPLDDIDADAFHAAHEAAPSLDPEEIRVAIDAYMAAMHLHVSRAHAHVELTAEEAIEAFRPKTVEF